MTLYIPTFADPLLLAEEGEKERRAQARQEYIDRKTRAAEKGEQRPYNVDFGSDPVKIAESMGWDFSAGWENRRLKQVRKMRQDGVRFEPAVRMPLPGGGFENVYPYGMIDLKWFEEGQCCVRCQNWKHEDPKRHEEQHAKLRSVLTIDPPADVPLSAMCGFCGNRLDKQKFRTKAA